MDKNEFTERLAQWLKDFLEAKYSGDYNIEILIPSSNFSKIANEKLKTIDGYTSFDFHSDVLGILEHKETKMVELILLNRSTSAISLKDIGEINCYSKLVKPKHSFIASLKGLPEEVNLILMNKDLEEKLLKINKDLVIIVFKWDKKTDSIDQISVFPIDQRDVLI